MDRNVLVESNFLKLSRVIGVENDGFLQRRLKQTLKKVWLWMAYWKDDVYTFCRLRIIKCALSGIWKLASAHKLCTGYNVIIIL